MPDSSSIAAPLKGHCLLWSRLSGGIRDSRDLEEVLDRGGWKVAVRDVGETNPSREGFDLILVEDASALPPEALQAMKRGSTLAAGILAGPVAWDRLAPFDILFCADPDLTGSLRGLGKAVHFVTQAPDRAERCLEILERHLRYRRAGVVPVDWSRISYGHAEITAGQVSENMTKAWMSEEIPARQRALVQSELREMYQGRIPKVYATLAEALRPFAREGLGVLEIGCASGYYYEILQYLLNVGLAYEGADYSEPLIRMARELYPKARFHVADGARLPFADNRFPVAISSCVLLHVPNWREHIRETARVAGEAVIAHRTPVCRRRPTQYLRKFAYGVETVELLFNEEEILRAFADAGLVRTGSIDLGGNDAGDDYSITYVFAKQPVSRTGVAASPPAAEGVESFQELIEKGEAAFSEGRTSAAKALFERAARMRPEDARLLNNLGVLACEEGEIPRGLELMRQAFFKDTTNRRYLTNLIDILSALGHDADARMLSERFGKAPAAAAPAAPRPEASPAPSRKTYAVAWRNRADMAHAKGGDGTVIEETMRCLQAMGHRADLRLESEPDLGAYDLVHLNNISRSQDTLEQLRHAKARGKKAVLTSLYEDMDRYLVPAMKTDLLFRYLATKRQVVPLEGLARLRDSFELDSHPLNDPLAKRLGIGDPARQGEILRGVDLILTSGKAESDSIRKKFGKTAPVTEMLYGFNRSFQSADARLFQDRHGLKDFALCVGRLEPRKNQWQLIEVFRGLPHLKLVLVGVFSDPSMEPLIKAYAPPNVVFFPRLSMEELASAYAAARLHVLPSWYELPGLVSLEAAAAGSRVATTDWGTAPDYFGSLAHYLPPDDPVRMRAAIREAFDSAPKPGLREYILETFSWENTARRALEAYARVLEA